MSWDSISWDDASDLDGNVAHIRQHGLTMDDVENAMLEPLRHSISLSSGRPMLWGLALDGELIAVVYDLIDADTVRPVTAWKVEQ